VEQEGDVPSARESHSAVWVSDWLYLFGGQDNEETYLNDLFVGRITVNTMTIDALDTSGRHN
jgi:hypothetical protein